MMGVLSRPARRRMRRLALWLERPGSHTRLRPKGAFCQIITDWNCPMTTCSNPTVCAKNPQKCRCLHRRLPRQSLPETDAHMFSIGDKNIRYARLNRPLCRTGVNGAGQGLGRQAASRNSPGRVSRVEDWLEIAKGDDPYNKAERVPPSMCGRCMTQCPRGAPN
jgi:hypothetical protein